MDYAPYIFWLEAPLFRTNPDRSVKFRISPPQKGDPSYTTVIRSRRGHRNINYTHRIKLASDALCHCRQDRRRGRTQRRFLAHSMRRTIMRIRGFKRTALGLIAALFVL